MALARRQQSKSKDEKTKESKADPGSPAKRDAKRRATPVVEPTGILELQQIYGNQAVQRSGQVDSGFDAQPAGHASSVADRGAATGVAEDRPVSTTDSPAGSTGAAASTEGPAAEATTGVEALIREDSALELESGQMRKSEFLGLLRLALFATSEEGLSGTGLSARDCPYLRFWLRYYQRRDVQHVQRAIFKYAPETRQAASAGDYIPLVASRVREAVDTWARTREVTGVPGDAPVTIGEASDPSFIRSQLGRGRPLDTAARSRMESAFGEDFSEVRVHTGPAAATLSEGLRARAFTVGHDIAFGHRQYEPGTLVGDAILAHELAHVVQQRGNGGEPAALSTAQEDSSLEKDANDTASNAVFSLWSRVHGAVTGAVSRIRPALKTGLRLQRCPITVGGPRRPLIPPRPQPQLSPALLAHTGFTPQVSGALRINDVPGAPAPGQVLAQSVPFTARGEVWTIGGTDSEAADFEAGFMQTALSARRRFDYYIGVPGVHYRDLIASLPGPRRDGDAGIIPWYGLETVKPLSRANFHVFPEMSDAPPSPIPWEMSDPNDPLGQTGQLVASDGEDRFCAWLVVRKISNDSLTYLNWATWKVDWAASYNPVAKTGNGTGTGSTLTGQGDGRGAETPLTGDPVANDSVVVDIV